MRYDVRRGRMCAKIRDLMLRTCIIFEYVLYRSEKRDCEKLRRFEIRNTFGGVNSGNGKRKTTRSPHSQSNLQL